jgi:S-DNA-T family DNA segregation ATPase FtsK/SpoIIIE
VDSRTILDAGGAEKLLGRGDMLYMPMDAPKPIRVQGVYISDPEVSDLVSFWKTTPRGPLAEILLPSGEGGGRDGES